MIADESWRQLEGETRSILFAAALLHDIAKPITTRIENGRIAELWISMDNLGLLQQLGTFGDNTEG